MIDTYDMIVSGSMEAGYKFRTQPEGATILVEKFLKSIGLNH